MLTATTSVSLGLSEKEIKLTKTDNNDDGCGANNRLLNGRCYVGDDGRHSKIVSNNRQHRICTSDINKMDQQPSNVIVTKPKIIVKKHVDKQVSE